MSLGREGGGGGFKHTLNCHSSPLTTGGAGPVFSFTGLGRGTRTRAEEVYHSGNGVVGYYDRGRGARHRYGGGWGGGRWEERGGKRGEQDTHA